MPWPQNICIVACQRQHTRTDKLEASSKPKISFRPLTLTTRHPQWPLPSPRPPIIRRLNNLATPLNRPPPIPHKVLCRLPPPRIPRFAPHNHALPPARRVEEPYHIRAQLIVPFIARADEVVAHPGKRQNVDPRVVRDASLQGGWDERRGKEVGNWWRVGGEGGEGVVVALLLDG